MANGFRRVWDEWADEILSRGDPLLALVLLWAVRQATWKESRIMRYGQEIVLRPGQFLFGEHRAAAELGLSRHQFRRRIHSLKRAQILHIKPHNRFSVGTVEKWELRAGDGPGSAQQNAQETHRKRTPIVDSRQVDKTSPSSPNLSSLTENPQGSDPQKKPENQKAVEVGKGKLETLKPQRKFSWLQQGKETRRQLRAYSGNDSFLLYDAVEALQVRLAAGERIVDRPAAILVEIDRIRNASQVRTDRTLDPGSDPWENEGPAHKGVIH